MAITVSLYYIQNLALNLISPLLEQLDPYLPVPVIYKQPKIIYCGIDSSLPFPKTKC